MRVDFVRSVELALEQDAKALFITGDLGFNALEGIVAKYGERFVNAGDDLGFNALEGIVAKYGERFVNAGVAEQNMVGVAAGMALTGMRPWVYSIAPFATYRCLEQIRNDVCLHDLPVRIVGNGGGYTYGIMGSTHHALEDLAVLKPLPNMLLFFPCANDHVAAAVSLMGKLTGPSYLRLAISAYATERAALAEHPVTLTRTYALRAEPRSRGVTVIGAGHAVQVALRALAVHGLDRENVDVFGVARFPFNLSDDSALAHSVNQTRDVIFIEEHYAPGGMGESMKLALPPLASFLLMSATYSRDGRYGTHTFHMQQCNLTPEVLVRAVRERLSGR